MTKEVVKNYTEAQEAELMAAGVIDNDLAIQFAEKFGKDVRSVRAKAVRMGIYKAKEKVSKTGDKIESKDEIAAEIGSLVGRSMDSLVKASKEDLKFLRAVLRAA